MSWKKTSKERLEDECTIACIHIYICQKFRKKKGGEMGAIEANLRATDDKKLEGKGRRTSDAHTKAREWCGMQGDG